MERQINFILQFSTLEQTNAIPLQTTEMMRLFQSERAKRLTNSIIELWNIFFSISVALYLFPIYDHINVRLSPEILNEWDTNGNKTKKFFKKFTD